MKKPFKVGSIQIMRKMQFFKLLKDFRVICFFENSRKISNEVNFSRITKISKTFSRFEESGNSKPPALKDLTSQFFQNLKVINFCKEKLEKYFFLPGCPEDFKTSKD